MTPSIEWLDARILELHQLLEAQGERNYIRGIANVLSALRAGQIEDARSIYRSMTNGGRGFAEYNVWLDDFAERRRANRRLDELRDELWDAFDLDEGSEPRVIGTY